MAVVMVNGVDVEVPRLLKRGHERLRVEDETGLRLALAQGWVIRQGDVSTVAPRDAEPAAELAGEPEAEMSEEPLGDVSEDADEAPRRRPGRPRRAG